MFKSLMAILLVLSIPAFGQKVLDAGATSPAAFSLRQLATTYNHTSITPPTAVSRFTNATSTNETSTNGGNLLKCKAT